MSGQLVRQLLNSTAGQSETRCDLTASIAKVLGYSRQISMDEEVAVVELVVADAVIYGFTTALCISEGPSSM